VNSAQEQLKLDFHKAIITHLYFDTEMLISASQDGQLVYWALTRRSATADKKMHPVYDQARHTLITSIQPPTILSFSVNKIKKKLLVTTAETLCIYTHTLLSFSFSFSLVTSYLLQTDVVDLTTFKICGMYAVPARTAVYLSNNMFCVGRADGGLTVYKEDPVNSTGFTKVAFGNISEPISSIAANPTVPNQVAIGTDLGNIHILEFEKNVHWD
jgi:hypothetical protein